ncbi:MAG: Nif3-like dinuclear metal center hexameric protein [Candidatus Sumerlaeota bacterium]|nr:Nif3-like dinuclear metal center hexameric protein [Candidatus Sumerlaeota bacterium]
MLIIDGLMQVIDRLAPFRLAESWDNVGLQLGDPKAPARRIAVALEVTLAIVRQTLSRRADALVVHHPLIFQPLKTLSRESPQGAMISDLIAGGVALIAAHTNLDVSPAGTNAALAELIGLRRLTPLFDLEPQPAAYKFVVYVPQGYEAAIIEAIARGGGGVIGAYDHCSYRCAGIGTYRPLKGARPFAGRVGRLEQAVEWRLEADSG